MSMDAGNAVETAKMMADRLRSFSELDTSNANPDAYGAVVVAYSNIAIAEAIRELADTLYETRSK